MTSKPKVKPNQRLSEYPNQGFMIADGNLYCNYCNCNANWIHKSDVLRHTQTAKHAKARQRASANASIKVSGNLGNGPDVPDSDPEEGSSTQTVVLSTVSSSRGNAPKRQRTQYLHVYNKLVCSSRLSLSDESVRVLHSAVWNGEISGRFSRPLCNSQR